MVIPKTTEPLKHICIIGGGPAGLEAARVAAERGHKVTLYEAASKLGGQLLLATKATWRRDIIAVVDWRVAELEHLGVNVHLNRFVEANEIEAMNADVVLVATGGLPNIHNFDGQSHVSSTWDALNGDVAITENVLIWDGTGRHEGVSCAQYLANKGATVSFAMIDDRPAAELGYAERPVYRKQLYTDKTTIYPDLMLLKVEPNGNRLKASFRNDLTDETVELHADQVVVEQGTTPLHQLYTELRASSSNLGVTDIDALLQCKTQPRKGPGYELHRIGDAVSSRSLHAALLDAYRIAVAL